MNPPAISICISTKNRNKLLFETLHSIKCQTFADYEVVVWDNGIGAGVVVADFDARFNAHRTGEDFGMAGGFNKSLSLATGELVLMLSDDDLLHPDALETLIKLQRQHPQYGAWFGGTDMLQEHPEIAQCTLHRIGLNSTLSNRVPLCHVFTLDSRVVYQKFLDNSTGMYLFWSGGIVRRSVALKVGAFPDYGTPLMGDFHYTFGTCAEMGCALINKSVCVQRVHHLNHGRVGDCDDLRIVARAFPEAMERIIPSHANRLLVLSKLQRFARHWLTMHAIFLRLYFRQHALPNALGKVLKKEFSLGERIRVMLACWYITSMNRFRRQALNQ